jgi:hypothetical protein
MDKLYLYTKPALSVGPYFQVLPSSLQIELYSNIKLSSLNYK